MSELEKIDTSYWLTKDKDWKEQRNAQWPAIEKVLGLNRRKSEVNVIKAYFLRGKMPNWSKYRDWNEQHFRHVDLDIFLWLHPSDDPKVLKPLFIAYIASELVHPEDILVGYSALLGNELISATSPYPSLADYPYPYRADKNIIMFRLLFEDVNLVKDRVCSLLGQKKYDKRASHLFNFLGYHHFLRIRVWLLQDVTSPLMLNCLYQYNEVLDWFVTTIIDNSNKEFLEELKVLTYVKQYQKALYCIYHFDAEKGEVSCRSKALVKVRQLLDNNDFIPEFKQMWEGIKSGDIEVENPWQRR